MPDKNEVKKRTEDIKEKEKENLKKDLSPLVKNEFIIDPEKFSLPDFGDYLGDEMSMEYIKKFSNNLENKDAIDPVFYLEKPCTEDLGFYEDGDVLVIKAKTNINDYNTRTNAYDGDTLYFNIDSVIDGNDNFKIGGKEYKNAKDYLIRTKGIDGVDREFVEGNKPNNFGIRFLGIDAPEVPKFMEIPADKNDEIKIMFLDELDGLGNNYHYEINDINNRRKKNTKFIKLDNNNWHEIVDEFEDFDKSSNKKIRKYRICYSDTSEKDMEYAKQAKGAKDTVKEMIDRAEDMRIVMDLNTASLSGSVPPEYSDSWFFDKNKGTLSEPVRMAQKYWDNLTGYRANMYAGFNAFGMDNYRRFLGVVYVKVDGQWINLSKYVAAKYDKVKLLPDYSNDPMKESIYDYKSDVFKMWSYNKDAIIVDAMKAQSDIDDRNEIQKAIFGRSMEALSDWTVMIGDCVFMVPPTSIKLLLASQSQSTPLIRSKGSALKTEKKDSRILQIDLYFNEDRGINGYPVDVNMPGLKEDYDGSLTNIKRTYYMNGLRPLISMFKFTPFLPIENAYINKQLGIDAVSLVNLNVQSVKNMPKTIKASIVLQEFDYRVYMPEIPVPEVDLEEDLYQNLFSKTINYEVMRYYYQRPLAKGEDLVDLPVNSYSYIKETLGSKTALQPMKFKNPYIKFYQIDKDFLARKHQSFMERERRGMRHLHKPTKVQQEYKKEYLAPTMKELRKRLLQLRDELNNSAKNRIKNKGALSSLDVIGATEKIFSSLPEYEKTHTKAHSSKLYKETHAPKVYVRFSNQNATSLQLDNMFKNYAEELNVPKDSFVDNMTYFEFEPYFDNKLGCVQYNVSNKTESSALMGLVLQQDELGDYETIGEQNQEDKEKDNRHTDLETPLSLKFVEVPTPPIIVTDYSVSMSNTFNNISLQMSSGYAPQYLGGQDIMFNVGIETTDEETVTFLSNLPRDIALTCREYREILTVYPVRIDTEFTRFFGVNEVLIEAVNVESETGPNGALKKHWRIELVLRSVDRTIRNREALKNISKKQRDREIENPDGKIYEDPNDYSFSGGSKGDNKTDIDKKNYWQMDNLLAEAEVYPDLELPTVYELERNGFKFVRYSNSNSNRVFPDPDFYFYYGHILGNEIFRTTIINFLGEQEHLDEDEVYQFKMYDSSGSEVTIRYDDSFEEGFEIVSTNEEYEEIIKAREGLDKAKNESSKISYRNNSLKNTYEEVDDLSNIYTNISAAMLGGSWNVSDNIIVKFREEYMTDKTTSTNKGVGELYDQMEERKENIISALDSYLNKAPKFMEHIGKNISNEIAEAKSLEEARSTISFYTKINSDKNILKVSKKVWDNFKKSNEYKIIEKNLNLEKIKIGHGEKVKSKDRLDKLAPAMIASIASARTGLYEFDGYGVSSTSNGGDKVKDPISGNKDKKGWESEVLGYCITSGGEQDLSSSRRATTMKEVINDGYIFGRFGIRSYNRTEITNITNEDVTNNKTKDYFIDPYFRNKATQEEVDLLKLMLLIDESAGPQIAFRESLFWLKKLIEEDHLITILDLLEKGIVEKLVSISGKGKASDLKENPIFEVGYLPIDAASSVINTYDKYKKTRIEEYHGKDGGIWSSFKKGVSVRAGAAWDTFKHPGKWVMNTVSDTVTYMGYAIELREDDAEMTEMSDEERATAEEYVLQTQQLKSKKEQMEMEKKQRLKDADILLRNLEPTIAAHQAGKIFVACILAATNGSEQLLTLIRQRDYATLESITKDIARNLSGNEDLDNDTIKIRKYVRALAGHGIIPNPERIGSNKANTAQDIVNMTMSKIYLRAAEQPLLYLQHSYYDMIVNDKRGRMLRAFPTFYMLFIDEGREIGWWKLHDNFYNMSSIASYQIVKSRKIPADTAIIHMNNMFQTFDRYDDDLKDDDEYTMKDYVTSIFSPRTYYLKEELKRKQQEEVNRTQLRPGIRTHIRMGYGANASRLPIVFNGSITDIQQGDVVQLVAQGDGFELTNELLLDVDAEDVQHQDKIPGWRAINKYFQRGATPKTIASTLMLTGGGFLKSSIRKLTKNRVFNDNPFGIVHFGDKEFKEIFPEGEVVQNIYEATSKPQWSQKGASGMPELYGLKDAPKISIDLFGKTFWDVLHICASVSPDFIVGIAPFGFRSTVFMGKPRYYYAYDYEKTEDGQIIERRKPYQQYHILTSYSDIIQNNMKATEQGIATCAVGIYDRAGWASREVKNKTVPLWADINIYPEYQKTMTVDLGLMAKTTPIVSIIPGVAKWQNVAADTKGNIQGGAELAFRMTSNALATNMKDMYREDIITLGNPAIKPHDRINVVDLYERIDGTMLVEAVVHNFSVETGYTTSIYPDMITVVDDPHELMNHNLIKNVMAKSLGIYITSVIRSQAFAGNTVPLMTLAFASLKTGITTSVDNANTIMRLLNKNDITGEKLLRQVSAIEDTLGLPSMASALEAFMGSKGLGGLKDLSGGVKAAEKAKKISDVFSYHNSNIEKLNGADFKMIQKEIDKSAQYDLVKDLRKTRDTLDASEAELIKRVAAGLEGSMSGDGLNLLNRTLKDLQGVDMISSSSKTLDKLLNDLSKIQSIQTVDDYNTVLDIFKTLERYKDHVPNYEEVMNLAKDFTISVEKGLTNELTTYFANSKELDEALSGLDKIKYALQSNNLYITLGLIVIERIIIAAVFGSITSHLSRVMRSHQVLQLFPVKKNGKVLTAGLDGSKGTIVGSPTYNDRGTLQRWIGDLYDYDEWNGLGKIVPFVINMISSQGMQEAAAKYQNNDKANKKGLKQNTEMINKSMQYLTAEEVRKQNAYHGAIITPRINNYKTKENKLTEQGKMWFHRAGVLDTSGIEKNAHISNETIPLVKHHKLKEAMDEEFLILAHDTYSEAVSRDFTISGERVRLNCIEKNNTIDIPVLKEDAILLLGEIVEKIKIKLNPNSKDFKDRLRKQPIVVQSCLVAGAKNLSCTGLNFTISAPIVNNLEDVLNEVIREQKEIFDKMSFGELKFFTYERKNNSSTTYKIEVLPPYSVDTIEENLDILDNLEIKEGEV